MRQEPRGRNALVDDLRGHRLLDECLTPPAYPLAPDVPFNLEEPGV